MVAKSHDHIDAVACRKLWISVLLSAMEQYRKDVEKEAREFLKAPENTRSWKFAERYIRSSDCRHVARLAGVEIQTDKALVFLRGEGPSMRWARGLEDDN